MSDPIFISISGARGAPNGTVNSLPYATFGASLLTLTSAAALAALVNGANLIGTITRQSGAQSLGSNSANFFTGSSSVTWTLPQVSSTVNGLVWIKNQGTAPLTVALAQSGDRIFDASAVTSISLNPGEARALLNDGVYWNTA